MDSLNRLVEEAKVNQVGADTGLVDCFFGVVDHREIRDDGHLGSLSRAGEHLLAGVREVVYGRSTPLVTENLQIVQSTAGRQAGIIGASVLAIDYLMAPENVDAWVGES